MSANRQRAVANDRFIGQQTLLEKEWTWSKYS